MTQKFKISPSQLAGFDFRVFGVVQGVHFRWYTRSVCEKQNLKGWVQNCTNQNIPSVIGQAQGKFDDLAILAYWLAKVGSPHLKIERLELKNCKLLDKLEFNEFKVRTHNDVRENNEPESEESKEIKEELLEYGRLRFESKS